MLILKNTKRKEYCLCTYLLYMIYLIIVKLGGPPVDSALICAICTLSPLKGSN